MLTDIYFNMKATVVHRDSKIHPKNHSLVNKFIEFLQKEYPLKDDVKIVFLGKRIGSMTTGSRTDENELCILTKKRINRDILRTLSHEWIHEYQRAVLKRPHGPDIGGVNEDEANAISGQLMKIFEKEYPELEDTMYE
jgi:hypothetical protein